MQIWRAAVNETSEFQHYVSFVAIVLLPLLEVRGSYQELGEILPLLVCLHICGEYIYLKTLATEVASLCFRCPLIHFL